MNMANEGGVFNIESDSNLTCKFDIFQNNYAVYSAGAIFITTRSIMALTNTKFIRNSAKIDAAITSLKTSLLSKFLIHNSLFRENFAENNIFSIKESYGVI
jgi:hypothetical protein